MKYYEVLVASQTYHGQGALTYSSEAELKPGTVVRVMLRTRAVPGIVLRAVPRPDFDVKPVSSVAADTPLPVASLALLQWIHAYYPAPLGSVVRLFVPPTLAESRLKLQTPDTGDQEPLQLPPLTDAQKKAVATMSTPGTFLLHGITGSGKSRVYVELAKRALQNGKSALVLTPEIGLTAQLTRTFRQSFGSDVFVLHSQLTAAERRDIYYALLERKRPAVVIGPRSALFSPLRTVGLIVLDESHDSAYKNESAPHYQAARVAARLSDLHSATLVLGSATPSVEDYFLATARKRPIVAMGELARGSNSDVKLEVIDMRRKENFARSTLFSDALLGHIDNALARGEQTLVYLNRRGTANAVLCQNCGWQALCPNCDLALTYHADSHNLRCHVCGFTSVLPTVCPVCSCAQILFKSVGTKAVADALAKLFPTARIRRFDTDAKKSERLEQHLDDIIAGGADIIVGTQMVGKGLDLPRLSVVGIVNADSSLLIPDYTAAEQTFQHIAQVMGRVGRGHLPGYVVAQTYDPENITLQAALGRDWQRFYDAEIQERKTYQFPPFVYMLKLRVLRATSRSAEQAAGTLAGTLREKHPGITVDGPAPSFHPREHGKYSWQLLVKSPARKPLVDIAQGLPSGWSYDIDPINLL